MGNSAAPFVNTASPIVPSAHSFKNVFRINHFPFKQLEPTRLARNLHFVPQRLDMQLVAERPMTDTYSVEASGWDSAQSFFVEEAELKWNELNGKHVTLTRSLSPGSMIFLRLLQPISPDRSLPWPITRNRWESLPKARNSFG
jgi:hypothetical protein